MILHTLLVSGVFLVGAYDDYQAVMSTGERVCVRPNIEQHWSGEQFCRWFSAAALAGQLPGVPAGTIVHCEPKPGCIPAREDYIKGFNYR